MARGSFSLKSHWKAGRTIGFAGVEKADVPGIRLSSFQERKGCCNITAKAAMSTAITSTPPRSPITRWTE